MRVLANWQIEPEMVTLKAPYKIVGDSLLIESDFSLFKFSKSNGTKQKMVEATWDVSFYRKGLFALNPVLDQLTEQQRLHRIAQRKNFKWEILWFISCLGNSMLNSEMSRRFRSSDYLFKVIQLYVSEIAELTMREVSYIEALIAQESDKKMTNFSNEE